MQRREEALFQSDSYSHSDEGLSRSGCGDIWLRLEERCSESERGTNSVSGVLEQPNVVRHDSRGIYKKGGML